MITVKSVTELVGRQPGGEPYEVEVEFRVETFMYGEDADGRRGERRTEVEIIQVNAAGVPEKLIELAIKQAKMKMTTRHL